MRRWSRHRCIHRRQYSVPHPNAVWHIDGNMALIRWGLTVHAGVDGYSRLITNNSSSTVLRRQLVNMVVHHGSGLTMVVRTLMLLVLCLLCAVFTMAATSLANQLETKELRDFGGMYYRIIFMCTTTYFTCWKMVVFGCRQSNILALQYVYVPRINHTLSSFREAWNNHGLIYLSRKSDPSANVE